MKTVKLNEILLDYDSPALSGILDYWKDYEPKTVIIAYAELRRRKYGISKWRLDKLKEFCEKNNQSDIENYLNKFLSNSQSDSFEEYIEKRRENKQVDESTTFSNNFEGTRNRYPALITIANVYKVFAWIVGIVSFIVAIFFMSQTNFGVMISLISIVIGAIMVLGLLAISESIKVFIDIEFNTREKH